MKRRFGTVIAMVLCFILTVVSVYADDGKGQNPDYVTDFGMTVAVAVSIEEAAKAGKF